MWVFNENWPWTFLSISFLQRIHYTFSLGLIFVLLFFLLIIVVFMKKEDGKKERKKTLFDAPERQKIVFDLFNVQRCIQPLPWWTLLYCDFYILVVVVVSFSFLFQTYPLQWRHFCSFSYHSSLVALLFTFAFYISKRIIVVISWMLGKWQLWPILSW